MFHDLPRSSLRTVFMVCVILSLTVKLMPHFSQRKRSLSQHPTRKISSEQLLAAQQRPRQSSTIGEILQPEPGGRLAVGYCSTSSRVLVVQTTFESNIGASTAATN